MSYSSIIIIFLGTILISKSLYTYIVILKLRRWQKVDIKILNNNVISKSEFSLHSSLYRYYPNIEFEYYINGKSFRSNKISIDKNREWSYYENETKDLLKTLIEKKIAYINPKYIAESVLINKLLPKSLSHHLSLLISGVALLTIGLLL